MRMIEAKYHGGIKTSVILSNEDAMATRIQRAWRRYRTRKLLRTNTLGATNEQVFNILD